MISWQRFAAVIVAGVGGTTFCVAFAIFYTIAQYAKPH